MLLADVASARLSARVFGKVRIRPEVSPTHWAYPRLSYSVGRQVDHHWAIPKRSLRLKNRCPPRQGNHRTEFGRYNNRLTTATGRKS